MPTKKKKLYKINTPERLHSERGDISRFVMASLRDNPEGRVAMTDVYTAYRAWRKKTGLDASKLSIDSFGRVFPRGYERKPLLLKRSNRRPVLRRGLAGVELRA